MSEPIRADALRAAAVLCDVCAGALLRNVDEDVLKLFVEGRDAFLHEPFVSVSPDDARVIVDELARGDGDADASDALFHDLRRDYTHLFYMVAVSGASPYESAWRTEDRTLCGPFMHEVRAMYRSYGVEVSMESSVPDDHLGLELAFASDLLSRSAASMGKEREDIVDDLCTFFSDHVLVFAHAFLDAMAASAHTPYYRAFARLTSATVDSVAALIGARASAAPFDPSRRNE
ncbi:TorD/DmsD family molecular chaperone [Slackia exigua]|uniref:TorD/DmsD family molecular chaperone n=1 Tax=Slackia exigua TaxID=84109 RepID=UPI0023F3E0B7|nr:molecular chaperone TorD family protein [Slackia exigua]